MILSYSLFIETVALYQPMLYKSSCNLSGSLCPNFDLTAGAVEHGI